MEASEFSIRRSMHQVGGVLMEKLINSDQGDHRGARITCQAGHEAEFIEYRIKQVTTVLSKMGVKRAYYYCSSCGRGILPKDKDLDIENTSFSPGVRRMMARVGAKESFDDGRTDLEELAGVSVTAKEAGRVSEAIGEQVEAVTDRERVQVMEGKIVPLAPAAPILYIAIDGTGVPVVPSETEGRQGKQTKTAKTREAKLGALFTQTTVDSKGHPVRDEASTSYVGSIETAEAFGSKDLCRGGEERFEPGREGGCFRRRRGLDPGDRGRTFSECDSDRGSVPCPGISLGGGEVDIWTDGPRAHTMVSQTKG